MDPRKQISCRVAFLLGFVLTAVVTFPQVIPEKGVPQLINYPPVQYQNMGKIWDICTAPNGIVYMAADKGLLEFDGKTWTRYRGSPGITRSVLAVNDSILYTGSDLDFGVWNRNRSGAFIYTSLYPFKDNVQEKSEEFWDIHQINGNILFVSSQNIYQIKDQIVITIGAPSEFTGSFLVNDTLFLATSSDGLYFFDQVSLKLLFPYPEGAQYEIQGVYNHQGIVLVTRNAGLLRYSSGTLQPVTSAISEIAKTAKIFSFTKIGSTHLAFGTVTKGLFLTDLDGNILHQINKYKGLISNTILSIHFSAYGHLWMGMDYGISRLGLNHNVTYFYDYRGDYGTGYVARIYQNKFFMGTNQGLYYSQWSDLDNGKEFTQFHLVPGTEGQVWALHYTDEELLVGHDRGLFRMKGSAIEKVSDHEGVWTIVPYDNYILTGNYNGIEVFEKVEGQWVFRKKMELIMGSCNQLIVDNEKNLWIGIPNYGVIRIVLDNKLTPVHRMIFLFEHFQGDNPYLFLDQGKINLITDQAQYTYADHARRFIRVPATIPPPLAENIPDHIYRSFPLHPEYDFYPIYNGFALKSLNYHDGILKSTPDILMRRSEAFNNHETIPLFPGDKVPFRLNNLRFHFIIPNCDNITYQYRIISDDPWKPTTADHSLVLTGLQNGSYILHLRALSHGEVISEFTMPFHVAAPWYRSKYLVIAIFLMLLLVVIILRRWHLLTLKKQKKKMLLKEQKSLRKLNQKHREKMALLEQERFQEEYEQVKQQLKNKTIELAIKAKDSEDQNRVLMSLKEKFKALQNDPGSSKTRISEINRLLDTFLNADDRTFQIQMDELHQDFFRKLKEEHPALSSNDLRLCAYLKVGLNSKEIAEILNIQPSSSYISRSRLRKKLNLQPDEDLYDFLSKI